MIYEYECTNCDNIFDIMCKMSEYQTPRQCPKCGTISVRFYGNQNMMAIPHERIGRAKVPDGFKDVLRIIRDKAIGGENMKSNAI